MKTMPLFSFGRNSAFLFSFVFLFLQSLNAHALSVTFSWTKNPETLIGYRLYYKSGASGPPYNGTGAIEGPSPVETGNVTSFTIHGLSENETYYFTLTAYNSQGESGYSNELVLYPASPTNTLPTASAGSFSIQKNTAYSGRLTASDPDNDPLTFILVSNGSLGAAEITDPATGSFTYTPTLGSLGEDAFAFKVNDGHGDSNIASIGITILGGNEPPRPVISTSSTVGEVPLTVHFDGTGSSDSDGTIQSFTWDFGDGISASGPEISHTYTMEGTYSAVLTVTDNSNSSASATTPILTTKPVNESPQALISVAADQGTAPMTVFFNGGGSVDPDGKIIDYFWNFNDGTIGSGPSATHVFTRPGTYSASLTVTDNQGAADRSSRVITVREPDPSLFFEFDRIQLNHQWKHVAFTHEYTRPVVVAGPLTNNGGDPSVVRIRNVTSGGFDIRVQEWEYLDGNHTTEEVSYMIMEQGVHTLEDGTRIEAGTLTGRDVAERTFAQSFRTKPVVFSSITSVNDATPVTGRTRYISTTGFQQILLEEEANDRYLHAADETVSYIAIEPGSSTLGSLQLEVGTTGDEVTDKWYRLDFQTTFANPPHLFLNMQDIDDWDTCSLRADYLDNTSAYTFVEEEASQNRETKHTTETVGYMVILDNR